MLTEKGFPLLFERQEYDPIRMWVPACSTGEETHQRSFRSLSFHQLHRRVSVDYLRNLISNAIKDRSPDRPLAILFSTEKQEDFVRLTLSDNGQRIDLPKNGKSLFKPLAIEQRGGHRLRLTPN